MGLAELERQADALLERIESRLIAAGGEEARAQRIRWLRSREFRDEEAARRRASREIYGG